EKELAILKGRVDGLEAKVGELEANQFSTTTRLEGLATFVVGGVNSSPLGEEVTFNHDVQLALNTSFTGKDLLVTILRAGNFGDSAFGNGLATLETAFQEDSGAGSLGIDKLYYQFPIGESFTATIGGRVGQEDMLAIWPSAYPSDTVLDLLTLNGAPLAYNKNLGPGFGLWWEHNGFAVSANYVAANGADAGQGLFNSRSGGTATVQVGYGGERWGVAAIYSQIDGGVGVPGATPLVAEAIETGGDTSALGLSGFWQPAQSGLVPSISAGYGYASIDSGPVTDSQSWFVGLQWEDAFLQGNAFGIAVGQPGFATSTGRGVSTDPDVVALEAWYKWQVTDAISVTPAVFYISDAEGRSSSDQFGALLKTSFRF
ncbi:MAG: iron uptake porin, partial [Synechococcaceae cyanobacterium]